MNIDIPSLILINGSQGLGKSYLIRYLMYEHRKDFHFGVIFTNTYFEDDSFEYVKKSYVHPEYNEEVLQNLMDLQIKNKEKGIEKQGFVIFDDCLYDRLQFSSEVLKRLCTQLRHFNLTVIMSTQYPNSLPSCVRANAMSVFMFNTNNKNALEALYNSYGQAFDNYNEFKKYILTNTGDHKFIYYNKMKPSENIYDDFKIMRAPSKIPKFKIKFNKNI